jgi:membrane protease YdiL (CAAX protease family)
VKHLQDQSANSPAPRQQRSWLQAVFISPTEPRLRAGWRLLLQVVLQLALTTCLGLALVLGWPGLFTVGSSTFSADQILPLEIAELLAITASVVIARRLLDRRTFASLGLQPHRDAFRDFGAGLLITLAMMGIIFAAEIHLGWLHVTGFAWQSQPAQEVVQNAGVFLLICLLVGWNEELMSRGYHLQTAASGLNVAWGWILSSVAFGLLHLANPNASPRAAAGIFLAGMFLGYAFIRSRQLWLPIGLHVGWNYFEGVVFGFPVSGLDFYALPHTTIDGPLLWTGGAFGPEAGLLLLPALAIGFLLVHLYTRGPRPA